VQGAVGPFDRLFEAPRGEMSDSDNKDAVKGRRIERAQTARPFDGFDRRLGLVAQRVDIPSGQPGVSRVSPGRGREPPPPSPPRRQEKTASRQPAKSFRRYRARLRAPVGPGGRLRRCPHPTVLPTPASAAAHDRSRPWLRPGRRTDRSPTPGGRGRPPRQSPLRQSDMTAPMRAGRGRKR